MREPQPLEITERRWGVTVDGFNHISQRPKWDMNISQLVYERFKERIDLIPSKCDHIGCSFRSKRFRGTETATDVAECFLDNTFQLHELQDSIVSLRDPKFTSKFWSIRKRMVRPQLS